jgi:acyl dehydratase
VTSAATARDVGSITVGEEVVPFEVTLTLQRLVMEAGANRDFAPIHFDPDAARESGAAGPYANTTFIETLFEAALRTWAGLSARILMIEFSMKSFNCVGDAVSARGVVSGVRGTTIDLDLWIEGPRGRTVTGRATVAFPDRP